MILLINTCGTEAVVALAEGDRIVSEQKLPGRQASEGILPALRTLLAQAGSLRAICVVHGPGSFTGVRVGLSVGKGLCEARGVGMIAMSRLALVAMEARRENALAVLDAGRGEFFCGFYRGQVLVREVILKRDELLPLLRGQEVLTSEPRVHEALAEEAEITLITEPGAFAMSNMARSRIARGEWSDVATIDANYLRRTDAELLKERQ